MKLVVDIGNTNLKWTLVTGGGWRPGESAALEQDTDVRPVDHRRARISGARSLVEHQLTILGPALAAVGRELDGHVPSRPVRDRRVDEHEPFVVDAQ